jgi:predicted transcriptional regulator
MKSVMISIRPKWCELIASGKKTIEVRKTKPQVLPPFKCYIYCTQTDELVSAPGWPGRVIGEFICDWCDPFKPCHADFAELSLGSLVTPRGLYAYANGKTLYGWHITDLKLYAEPKEISEFERWWNDGDDIRPCQNGKRCQYLIYDYTEDCQACAIDFDGTDCPYLKVKRPPQSWCYVEETE